MSRDWLADAETLAAMTGRAPGTIRSWASRWPDKLPRRGKNEAGFTLYAVEDAEKLAAELAGHVDNAPASMQHESR